MLIGSHPHIQQEESVQEKKLVFDAEFVAERIKMLVASEPKEFAYRTGVSLSAVYNYMNGRTPAITILVQIALVYGKTLDWFFGEFQLEQRQDEFVERRLELVRPKRAATA